MVELNAKISTCWDSGKLHLVTFFTKWWIFSIQSENLRVSSNQSTNRTFSPCPVSRCEARINSETEGTNPPTQKKKMKCKNKNNIYVPFTYNLLCSSDINTWNTHHAFTRQIFRYIHTRKNFYSYISSRASHNVLTSISKLISLSYNFSNKNTIKFILIHF